MASDDILKKDLKKANVSKPRDEHWYLAARLVKVLKPFEQATVLWPGSRYVTISTAIPVLHAQLDKVLPLEKDLPAIYAMKSCLRLS